MLKFQTVSIFCSGVYSNTTSFKSCKALHLQPKGVFLTEVNGLILTVDYSLEEEWVTLWLPQLREGDKLRIQGYNMISKKKEDGIQVYDLPPKAFEVYVTFIIDMSLPLWKFQIGVFHLSLKDCCGGRLPVILSAGGL